MLLRILVSAALVVAAVSVNAVPISVDLSSWQADLYTGPNQASGGGSTWTVEGTNNDSVFQSVNGQSAIFFEAGSNAQGTALSGTISVDQEADDDFIGFVLGYELGEINLGVSDFYLIDWKQGNQNLGGNYGNGLAGLAISHVTAPNGGGFWGHDTGVGTVHEIVRASSLGTTGWNDNQQYLFDLVFTQNLIQVSVDGVLEISVTAADFGLAAFDDGAFGFYNYSQRNVRYAGITEELIIDRCIENPNDPACVEDDPPQGTVPEPTTILLFGLGLLGMFRMRGRSSAS